MSDTTWLIYSVMVLGAIMQGLAMLDRKRLKTVPEHINRLGFWKRIPARFAYFTEDWTLGYRYLPGIDEKSFAATFILYLYALLATDVWNSLLDFDRDGTFMLILVGVTGVSALLVAHQLASPHEPASRERKAAYILFLMMQAVVSYELLSTFAWGADAFVWPLTPSLFLTGASLFSFVMHLLALRTIFYTPRRGQKPDPHLLKRQAYLIEVCGQLFTGTQHGLLATVKTLLPLALILLLNEAFHLVAPETALAFGMGVVPYVANVNRRVTPSSWPHDATFRS